MRFHVEKKIRLNTAPRHPNLYSWSLQEIDDTGAIKSPDLIPWGWSLYFSATDVTVVETLTVKEERKGARAYLSQEAEVTQRRLIRVTLKSGTPFDEKSGLSPTSYQMFGTDRFVSEFSLEIHPLKDEDEKEECTSWGSVRFTTEVDFKSSVTDDCLTFYLMVKPSTFAQYTSLIQNGANELILQVKLVSGFYSEWSPTIGTEHIKILTRGEEHAVEGSADSEFEIPRLGQVGEASLNIYTQRAFGTRRRP